MLNHVKWTTECLDDKQWQWHQFSPFNFVTKLRLKIYLRSLLNTISDSVVIVAIVVAVVVVSSVKINTTILGKNSKIQNSIGKEDGTTLL